MIVLVYKGSVLKDEVMIVLVGVMEELFVVVMV